MENASNPLTPVKSENEKRTPPPTSNLSESRAVKKEKQKVEAQEYQVIEVKRYKLIELAAIYKVNRKTFRGWVNKFKVELGPREGHYYSIAQVKLIFQKLELPSYVKVYND